MSSLLGIKIEGVAAGLWHTICISADGDVYAFGGNQFGQLGTGADQAEVRTKGFPGFEISLLGNLLSKNVSGLTFILLVLLSPA